MDLYCPTCTEPWDNDCLHDEAQESGRTYREVAADFRERGCHALETAYGAADCQPANNMRAAAMGAMFELCGDDMDGAASLMDDFEYMGMLD